MRRTGTPTATTPTHTEAREVVAQHGATYPVTAPSPCSFAPFLVLLLPSRHRLQCTRLTAHVQQVPPSQAHLSTQL
jgi:hypothetical protein